MERFVDSEQVLRDQLQDPEFAALWSRSELSRKIAATVIRYRVEKELTLEALVQETGFSVEMIRLLESGSL